MLKSTVSKALWVGRATSAVVGLAIMLALVVGVASAAFGANGDNFILGQLNRATAITKLVGNVAGGPALHVVNNKAEAGSRALQLGVAQGKPPLVVNPAAGKAKNLNADKLDGKDSTALVPGGVLPAGTTIRGHFEMDGHATGANQLIGGDSISFGYTLPSAPAVRVKQPSATAPAECPGISASPEAKPGNLCIYVQQKSNVSTFSPFLHNPRPTGANMFSNSAGAGGAFVFGTWAVTAPAAGEMSAAAQKQSDAPQQRPNVP